MENSKTCRNCKSAMPLSAKYCPYCSQKYTTGHISFFELCREFFSEHLNLDSKLFRTAFALLIPGRLTNEYFKGRHKSFASPLRLFIVTGVLLFAFVSFQLNTEDMDDSDMLGIQEDVSWLDFQMQLDSAKSKTDSIFTQGIARTATDSLIHFMYKDKEAVGDSVDINGVIGDIELPKFSKRDLINYSPDELVELYAADWDFTRTLALKQALKVQNSGIQGVVTFFIGKSSITLLLMMPFLALGLKFLYFRRRYYYVEHLIFAFHFHAFMFLTILILTLVTNYLNNDSIGPIIGFTILGIYAYLYIAMLRVYKQGWFKTLVKYFVLLFGYFSLAIFFTIISFLVSFILF